MTGGTHDKETRRAAAALAPAPKGRPPGPRRLTGEQRLEEENRRLKTEVAYLKKMRALEAAKRARGRDAR